MSQFNKTLSLIVAICFLNLFLPSLLKADVKLPAIMGNGMVLQQGKKISIWGTADAGEKVTVTFGKASANTKADADGNWRVFQDEQKANSTGQTLTVKGNNSIELKDVLVVAPYNAHVTTLQMALPEGARVGTVDRFQGQEAPVVIYSMASSSP